MRNLLPILIILTITFPALALTPVERFVRNLEKARTPEDRVDAIETLENWDQPESVAAIAATLTDEDARVRRAAASALWGMDKDVAAAAIPALRGRLDDPDAGVVIRVAGALDYLGVDDAELIDARAQALPRAERASDRFLAARELIGHRGGDEVAPYLVEYAVAQGQRLDGAYSSGARDNMGLVVKALERLVKTGDRSGIDPLVRGLGASANADVRLLDAMAQYEPPPDGWLDLLVDQTDRPPNVLAAALKLMAKLAEPQAIERWVVVASDQCRHRAAEVRSAVARALEAGKGLAADGAQCAVGLLDDREARVRKDAAEALEALGDRDQPVAVDVKNRVAGLAGDKLRDRALGDDSVEVRRAAVAAYDVLLLPIEDIGRFLVEYALQEQDRNARSSALIKLRNHGTAIANVIEPLSALEHGDDARLVAAVRDSAERASLSATRPIADAQTQAVQNTAAGQAGLARLRELNLEFTERDFESALARRRFEVIEAYMDAGFGHDYVFVEPHGRTLLFTVLFTGCRMGQPTPDGLRAAVREMLKRGADPNKGDNYGNSALMQSLDCDVDLVKMLIDAGADIYHQSSAGLDAFHSGVAMASTGTQALIDAGFRLDTETRAKYLEFYGDNPKSVALIESASAGR